MSVHTRQSRTYEPNDPDLRKKRVRAFRLEELERFSREYRDIHRTLLKVLPEAVFDPTFMSEVQELVSRYTEMSIDLWMDSVRVVKRTQLKSVVPGTTLLAIIGLAPLADKVLIEIDGRFVYRVVDALLGGHGVSVDIHRPLTEIEQGVFSFVLLKVLGLFAQKFEHPDHLAVRLEDMRTDMRSAADIVRHDLFWLCASWKMNYDLDIGYVRLFLPTSLARRIVPRQPPADSVLAKRMRALTRRRMNRLAGATASCAFDIGRIALTPEEISALDPGDIVVLDECTVEAFGPDAVRGSARLTIGHGRRGVVHGRLDVQEGTSGPEVIFEVSDIETHHIPGVHDPREIHGEPQSPEGVIAEYEDPQQYGSQNDDGSATDDDDLDEDWGIDDEDGNEEEFGDYEEYSEEAYGDGGYEANVEDGDHLVEAERLLGDVPINVVVELGRVELTADEVIRLRNGHLMELGRSPADPVDLVVAGKLLAKGELVEIEGNLGVKILNLVRDGER